MNYKEHSVIGVISLFILLPFIGIFQIISIFDAGIIGVLIFTIIGSLFPDIDLPNSKISKSLQYSLLTLGLIFLLIDILFLKDDNQYYEIYAITIVFPILSILLTYFINDMFGHRTMTHSFFLFGLILVTGLIISIFTTINFIYLICFLWGYLSHIIADGTTTMGVAYLYPFSDKFYYSFDPNGDSLFHNLIKPCLWVLSIVFLLVSIYYFFSNNFTFLNFELFPVFAKDQLDSLLEFLSSFLGIG